MSDYPLSNPDAKAVRYAETAQEIAAVLDGEADRVARMATVCAMLAAAFDHFHWTGFYVCDPQTPGELVVGPYQGTLGCLRIPFGKGVCGAAAATRTTQIVADVHAFAGHIACDSRSASEIVVPVFGPRRELIGVLDVDCFERDGFDEVDARGLGAILERVFGGGGPARAHSHARA